MHLLPSNVGLTYVRRSRPQPYLARTLQHRSNCGKVSTKQVTSNGSRKDHYTLPFIDQMLDRLAKHTHFCYLDDYSGFKYLCTLLVSVMLLLLFKDV